MLQASSVHNASDQARLLRKSGTLAFVKSPAEFQIRRATRQELLLLAAFFVSFANVAIEFNTKDDYEAAINKRQKLMMSFFVGIYHDLENMKKHYLNNASTVLLSKKSTGGGEGQTLATEEMQESTQTASKETDAQEDILSNILEEAEAKIDTMGGEDSIELDIF